MGFLARVLWKFDTDSVGVSGFYKGCIRASHGGGGGVHVVFRVLQGLYQVVGFRAVGALGA